MPQKEALKLDRKHRLCVRSPTFFARLYRSDRYAGPENFHETRVSAQPAQARPHAWFQSPHEDCRWTQGAGCAPRQGPQAPDPLISDAPPGRAAAARAAASRRRFCRAAQRARSTGYPVFPDSLSRERLRRRTLGLGDIQTGIEKRGATQSHKTGDAGIISPSAQQHAGAGCTGHCPLDRSGRRRPRPAGRSGSHLAAVASVEARTGAGHNRGLICRMRCACPPELP